MNYEEENEITEEEILFFLAKHETNNNSGCEGDKSACTSGQTCGGSPGSFVEVTSGPNAGSCWCECPEPPPPCCNPCAPCPPPPPSPPVGCCCCPQDYGNYIVEGEVTYQSGTNLMLMDFNELSTGHTLQFSNTVYLPPENLTENILKSNWNMNESTITNSFLVSYNGTAGSFPPGYLFINWNSTDSVGASIKIEYSTDNVEWLGWLILDMAGDQVGKVFFMLPKINGQFLINDYYFRVNYTTAGGVAGSINIKYSYNQLSFLKQNHIEEGQNEIWASQYYRPNTSKFEMNNFAFSFNNNENMQNLVKGPDIRVIKEIINE